MKPSSAKYLQMAAYVMLAFICVIVIGIAKNCSNMSYYEGEGNSAGDTLDIAILYGPGSFYMYSDTIEGINSSIADEFEKQTGTPIKIWPVSDPSYGMDKVADGTFDALASVPLDNYVKSRFLDSESVFLDRLVLVQMADSVTGETSVNSSLDLSGKTVYVALGSSAMNRMENLAEEIGGDIHVEALPEMSDELLCLKVATKEIPLAVVNERIVKEVAQDYPRMKYDTSISFTQFQVWIFNKSDSTNFNKFNSWFKEFKPTDSYRNIIQKY